MNRVKKLSIFFIMIMMTIYISTSRTYAALDCNVNLSTSKNEVRYEEQFSVYVAISNLETTNGIIAIGAVVSYDKDSLTLDSIEGQNNWSNTFYNASNGKVTSLKNELSNKEENIFKITFKVNEKGKAQNSAWVKISDFEISDGEEEKNCGGNSITINIKDNNTSTGNGSHINNNKPNQKPSTGLTSENSEKMLQLIHKICQENILLMMKTQPAVYNMFSSIKEIIEK